jgi:hypothetical protein
MISTASFGTLRCVDGTNQAWGGTPADSLPVAAHHGTGWGLWGQTASQHMGTGTYVLSEQKKDFRLDLPHSFRKNDHMTLVSCEN